ncbi:MAG: hypothetical protein ABWY57_14330 [Mycetocola sp.]
MSESCFLAAISAGPAVGTGDLVGVDGGDDVGGTDVGAPDVGEFAPTAQAESERRIRTAVARRAGRRRECRIIMPAYGSQLGLSRER